MIFVAMTDLQIYIIFYASFALCQISAIAQNKNEILH